MDNGQAEFIENLKLRTGELTGKPAHSGILEIVNEIIDLLNRPERSTGKVMIKEKGQHIFLNSDDIQWIESSGNYIKIVTGKRHHMTRGTMKHFKTRLNPRKFFRVHRSVIINVDQIRVIEPWFHGDYRITMKSGKQLTMSRNYKELLEFF